MAQSADRVPTHIGRFVVDSVLGTGGMGAVYKATDPTLKRTVAVKTVRPDIAEPSYIDRLVGEAQACARLDHPHIVTVYEAGQIDDAVYVVMEYLEGEDLAQALWRGELPFEARVRMLIQILEALEHAHAHGVIHRDIKPANIRVLRNGNIKIVDFGLARMTQVDARTVTGTIMGTLHYASPEQLRGEKVDGRTDIYSTGTMAYEMCTGRKPFDGEAISTIILKVIQDPIPPMEAQWSRTFPEIEKIIARAMAKNAADRYQTAEDMRNALTAFLNSSRDRIASAAAHDTVVVQQTLIGAQTLLRDGKDGDARALLEETLKRHPHSPGLRATLATIAPADVDATVLRSPIAASSAALSQAPPMSQPPTGGQSAGTWGATPSNNTATIGGQAPPVPAPQPKPRPWLVPAAAVVALSVIGAASYMMMSGEAPVQESTAAAAEVAPATPVTTPPEATPTPAAPPSNTAAAPAANAPANPPANPPVDLKPVGAAPKTEPPKPAETTAPPRPAGGAIVTVAASTAEKMFTDAPNTGLRYRVSRVARAGSETDIDPATTTFRSGDRVRLSFESNVDGYLYLVQQGSSGRWSVLFPNPDINGGRNRVRKSEEYSVPDDDGFFEFDANPGVENLFVYFSQEPMQELPGFGNKPVTKPETLTASAVTQLQGTLASRDLSFGRDPKPSTKSGNIIQANYVVNKSELGKAVSASFTLKHEP
jgi:eukaryotic-like serine/threonine-protein kinase